MTDQLLEAEDLSQVVEARNNPEPEVKAEVPEAPEKPEVEKEKPTPEELVNNYKAAVKEERQKRREIEARLRAQEERWAQADARLAQLFQAQQHRPEVPAYEADPIEHLRKKQEMTEAELQQFRQLEQQRMVQAQQQYQFEQLKERASQDVAEFRKDAPDYDDAYKFVAGRRIAELSAMGLTPQEIQATLARDEVWIIQTAHQRGQNPAELIYNMAKQTGYSAQPKQTEKMETLQKGVQASKSLGTGGSPGKGITLEQLAAMSQDEFDAFCKANGGMEKVMSAARK